LLLCTDIKQLRCYKTRIKQLRYFKSTKIRFYAHFASHPSVHPAIHSSMTLQPLVEPWTIFHFPDLFTQTVGLLGRGINPSQGHYLCTGQHKHRIKHTDIHASSWIRTHDLMISVFERSKIVHALDRTATVIGHFASCSE
jgi:hypothetical protein